MVAAANRPMNDETYMYRKHNIDIPSAVQLPLRCLALRPPLTSVKMTSLNYPPKTVVVS